MSAAPWWQSAVVYQIYPRSFATTGITPGVGDLAGVRERLPYLAWLGVDAVWLSPFFTSPMADFGYDVADYCDVDPIFGTLADVDELVAAAHDLGIRVLIDWVPNHSSDQHPWFLASRSSRDDPKRDWYVWADRKPDGSPPNNWVGAFLNGPAWTHDPVTDQSYLHMFLPEQPDLNWANPEVVEAMHDTLRFWLDRGIDGFRMDVVHLLGKDPGALDDWPEGHTPYGQLPDPPHAHEVVRGIRRVLDSYPGDRVSVGEVYLLSSERVARYYGDGDELHLSFNFPPLHAPWDAAVWRKRIDQTLAAIDPVGWPTWVLSNHDVPRHRTRYGGSEARARAAAVLLLGQRGTPFLYAGEELGLEDAAVPEDRVVDPGGRDGCRAPLPWDGSHDHGWGVEDPWLPWPPGAEADRNVEAQRADPGSIVHLYRRLLASRRASPALMFGTFAWLPAPDGVLAWERVDAATGDRRAVAVNFGAETAVVDGLAGWTVEVASAGEDTGAGNSEGEGVGEGARFDGTIAADVAVLLRPA